MSWQFTNYRDNLKQYTIIGIITKVLLAGDKFMSEMHLMQARFIYRLDYLLRKRNNIKIEWS